MLGSKESRKRQTETENKRRQLEQDRRQLQHVKSKALRERWLLEGAPSGGSEEHDAVREQLEEDEDRTHKLENNISSPAPLATAASSQRPQRPLLLMSLATGRGTDVFGVWKYETIRDKVEVQSQPRLDQLDLTQRVGNGLVVGQAGVGNGAGSRTGRGRQQGLDRWVVRQAGVGNKGWTGGSSGRQGSATRAGQVGRQAGRGRQQGLDRWVVRQAGIGNKGWNRRSQAGNY
ncbi:Paralemmin-1 [Merluccius polli]|uniref:Paralemmin-1 n=1 Tax=Merluccius polli TaxID=89951 RepID=A0AA47MSE6_MERPO|nr:Paralemmin-1 [Merluccius polli]